MQFVLVVAGGLLAYLAAVAWLFATGRRRGLGVSLAFFATAAGAGAWAILQSRSSTAGIGFLFLPPVAVLAGALGWGFRRLQGSPELVARLGAWACLAGAVAVVAWEIDAGRRTIALNRARDDEQRERAGRIERHRGAIAGALARSPGEEAAVLAALVREHAGDPEFLLPALESRFASPDDLDRFARKDEFGVTLAAMRNPNCRADTLVRIHRTHSYPDYFLQALSAHPNTPPDLLREIHAQHPRRIAGLDHWLARNPASPADVLAALARSGDANVLRGLVRNPALTCAMLPDVERSLGASDRPGDEETVRRLGELRAGPCR